MYLFLIAYRNNNSGQQVRLSINKASMASSEVFQFIQELRCYLTTYGHFRISESMRPFRRNYVSKAIAYLFKCLLLSNTYFMKCPHFIERSEGDNEIGIYRRVIVCNTDYILISNR